MTESTNEHTRVLVVRVEPDGDGSTVPEETHIRIKYLVELLGQAHPEVLQERKPLDTSIALLAHRLSGRLRDYGAGEDGLRS